MDELEQALERERKAGHLEGQVEAMEKMIINVRENHGHRLDHHDKRLSIQERISWGLIGIIGFIEFMEAYKSFMDQ